MATLKTGFEEFKQTYPDGINQSSPEIASPSVEQNTGSFDTGTVETGTVAPPAEQATDFNIPTTTEVSTKDLNVSTSDVMTARDEMESEAQKNLATLEGDRTTLQNQVLSSLQRLTGKSARQRELELQAGVEQDTADVKRLRTEIADIEAQMNQELQRTDLGITQRSILGEQSRIERRYLTEIGAKTAMMQALQGNIELAQATAQRTVDMEFAPIEQEIQVKLQELAFKEGDLTRAEAKVQAEAQAEMDAIQAQKDVRKDIFSIALDAQKNGADPSLVAQILSSQSPEEALVYGSSFVSPMAKLDLALKQQQLQTAQLNAQKTALEIAKWGQPTQKDIDELKAQQSNAKTSLLVAQDKVDLINSLTGAGLKARVGTTPFDRTATTKFGGAVKLLSYVGTKEALRDIRSSITGEQQAFAAGVHKVTAGLGLQELIEAKAQGATFGALSNEELRMLSNSATRLNDWEIKDENGKGIGVWNIDEATFQKELDFIREKTQRAMSLQQEKLFTPEESTVLDAAFSGPLSAESYYSK